MRSLRLLCLTCDQTLSLFIDWRRTVDDLEGELDVWLVRHAGHRVTTWAIGDPLRVVLADEEKRGDSYNRGDNSFCLGYADGILSTVRAVRESIGDEP